MSVLHPHWEFFPDYMDTDTALWWTRNQALFLRLLREGKNFKSYGDKTLSHNLLIYPPKYNKMETEMNGRKPKQPSKRTNTGDPQSSGFRWVNITLTSEDISALERETVSLEQLAPAYLAVGVNGLSLSCKYDSARRNFVCSIYRPSSPDNPVGIGVSGAADELRDALLVCLYKFNSCMGGNFDNAPDTVDFFQPRRFR